LCFANGCAFFGNAIDGKPALVPANCAMSLRAKNADQARKYYAQEGEIAERLAKKDPSNADAQWHWRISLNELGNLSLRAGNADQARQYYAQAREMAERLVKTDPDNVETQWELSLSRVALGKVAASLKHWDEAIREYSAALEILRRLKEAGKLRADQNTSLLSIEAEAAEYRQELAKASRGTPAM